MTAPGYKLDPEALEKAIRELQDVQDSVYELREKTALYTNYEKKLPTYPPANLELKTQIHRAPTNLSET